MRVDATKRLILLAVAALTLLAGNAVPAGAEDVPDPIPGVSAERILFGQSAALTGPASALGNGMRSGILAAFNEINLVGGIDGRRLELLSYDDRYEPEIAISNTDRLINNDNVFALIGPVGTPTSMAAEPIATAAQVPMIGPFTGAEFLRDAGLRSVINLRASYFQEAERIVDWLTRERGAVRVAILYQDDSYGRAGRAGIIQALERRGLVASSEGVYPRNTAVVKRALLSIRRGNPDAVIIIGAYQPSAEFIRWARKLELAALIVNVSFVGTDALIEAAGEAGIGTFISQVVPYPHDEALPLVAEYRSAMAALFPGQELGYVSLEGYLAGRLTIAVLRSIDGSPTREAFLSALTEIGHFDIGGFPLDFGPDDNQGSDQVFLTEIERGDRIVPLNDSGDAP
jgi:ABC-type branched-subunit amino acid transport system substrate-binding protein